MPKKTIRMFCYGAISRGPQYISPWEDVWIEYNLGKNNTIKEGPCIIGTYNLQYEIALNIEVIRSLPSEWRKERLNNLLRINNDFSNNNSFFDIQEIVKNMPDIYVNTEWVTKKVTEKAIEWYLKTKGVLKNEARFKWNKPKCVAIPTM